VDSNNDQSIIELVDNVVRIQDNFLIVNAISDEPKVKVVIMYINLSMTQAFSIIEREV
jgi:hypothetical protein